MSILPDQRLFDGFGPCALMPARRRPCTEVTLTGNRPSRRKAIKAHCPRAPGVYGMVDAEGALIYVGKSKSLRARLLSYVSKHADAKSRRLIAMAARLVWEPAADELAALLRELELIRRWRPRYNVRGQPRRVRRAYLCLGHPPAATLYVTRSPLTADGPLFGPVPTRKPYLDAIKRLCDSFRLRTCPPRVTMLFSDQRPLFADELRPQCLRHELGLCLAPCAAQTSRRQYARQVAAARRFLSGEDLSIVDRMHKAMQSAAAAGQFELAALWRDAWRSAELVADHLARMREARERFTFVYPLTRHGGGTTWYLVRGGMVGAAVRAPYDMATAGHCLEAMKRVYDGPLMSYFGEPDDMEVMLLLSAWFRGDPGRLDRTIAVDDARQRAARIVRAA